MEKITLTINDQQVTALKGQTILQVVNENKLDTIPTLCHDNRIEPYGSCFLCAVQVEGMNKLVPSCSTPVNEGMKIHTNNDQIRDSRKAVLELLLSNHYADCVGPCINNCPAGVDAQGYIALISMGKYQEALKLIKMNNPLPLSIGRVCVRNCEDSCRRCFVDDPVAINFLKRYVADIDASHKWIPEKKESNGRKVAIIGGGPAGLTCAYYLTLEGYEPTIFDKLPELGGMLRYGIPEYRLPKEILDSEIKWITDLGVTVKTGVEMGKMINIEKLKSEGYEAIFLGVGAHKASAMGLKDETQIKGVYKGIDFLREVDEKGVPELKGTVVIVGGGNTAIDAARTALRCGADKVKIVYRRSLKEMPAHHSEVEAAQAEGVDVNFLTNPKSIISDNGQLKAIECLKMELVEAPGERPRPVPVAGSEFIMECDYLISAIGQQVDIGFIEDEKDFKLEKWGTVIVNEGTFETSIPGVFAGGDVVSGALTAVNAIGHGKKAANSIDQFLKTGKVVKTNGKFYSFKHRFGEVAKNEFAQFKKIEREQMPEMEIKDRITSFKEVDLGFGDEQAANEVLRCLECGCSEYFDCDLRKYADEFNIDLGDYLGEVRKFKVDKRHPYIALDPNKCINCGKCVRTCNEILAVSALGFVNRGFKAVVKPAMEKPLLQTNCISCGNCIDVCPTGAISEKFPFKILGTMPKLNETSVCNFCSLGCKVNFKVVDNDIYFVSNSTEEIIDSKNNGYLCVKGRFGHRYLLDKNRLKEPGIRINGKLKTASLDDTMIFASDKIKEIISKYGKDSVAVFASPKSSNEELYMLQKFARVALKNNNITSLSEMLYGVEPHSLDDILGATVSTTTINEIKNTDVIIVMNPDIEENLILELQIKEARKKGAKLVLISSSESSMSGYADLWIDSRKGTKTILINGLINSLINWKDEKFAKLKETVSQFDPNTVSSVTGVDVRKIEDLIDIVKNKENNIVFVYNLDSVKDKSRNDIKAVCNLMSITGRIYKENNGLVLLREFSNSTGLQDNGATPSYLPGYVKFGQVEEINRIAKAWDTDLNGIFKPVDILKDINQGKIKAAIIFGENPFSITENRKYFNDVEFLMVIDSFNTETAQEADVIIPAATFAEQTGSYTSCDTMVQTVEPVIVNKNNLDNWKIISKFAEYFNVRFNLKSYNDLNEEISRVNRVYGSCKPGEYWVNSKENIKLLQDQKKADYLTYQVDMTTYNPVKPGIHYSDKYLETIRKQINL